MTGIRWVNAFYGGLFTAAGWAPIDLASALATPAPRSRASASPTTAREFFTQWPRTIPHRYMGTAA